MIDAAGDLIDALDLQKGCKQLEDAFDRCDGQSPPPDFVAGPAAPELAGMIAELLLLLGCE